MGFCVCMCVFVCFCFCRGGNGGVGLLVNYIIKKYSVRFLYYYNVFILKFNGCMNN